MANPPISKFFSKCEEKSDKTVVAEKSQEERMEEYEDISSDNEEFCVEEEGLDFELRRHVEESPKDSVRAKSPEIHPELEVQMTQFLKNCGWKPPGTGPIRPPQAPSPGGVETWTCCGREKE